MPPFALVGFGAAVAFYPGWISSAVAPKWAVLAGLTPFLARIDLRRIAPLSGLCLAAGMAWAALSLLWTPDVLTGLHEFLHLLILAMIVIAVSGLDDIDPILSAVGWGLAISSALCVVQWFGYSPVDQISAPAGLFYARMDLAAAVAPVFIWALLSGRYPLAAVLAAPMILCQTRTAIFAAVIGFLAAKPRLALFLGAAFLLAMLATWVFALPPFDAAKVDSLTIRFEIWRATLQGLSILGSGIGSLTADAFPVVEYAHSDILQAGYELGIGALPLLAFFAIAACGPITPARAALVVLGVEAAVSFSLHRPPTTGFLAFGVAGFLVCAGRGLCRRQSHSGVEIGASA